MGRTGRIAVVLGVIVGAGLLAFAFLRWTPGVPAGAADATIARTTMSGEIAPDPSEGTDPSQLASSPSGGECLPRIQRPDGWFDVCWEAHRSLYDADPQKDYYLLRVYGTLGPGANRSPRWAVLKGDLVGSPSDGLIDACPRADSRVAASPAGPEVLAGRSRSPPAATHGPRLHARPELGAASCPMTATAR